MKGSADMSRTDAISGELQSMGAGIDQALSRAGAAEQEAGQVAARAAAAGFGGVAVGVSRVQEAIREIRAALNGVGGTVGEALTAVGAVPKEASPAEVTDALSRVASKVDGAGGEVGSAINRVDETRALVARVLQGGDPGPLLSMLGAVKEILVMAAQRGAAARQSLDSAINDARRTGSSGN
ncbi:DUF6244 family protein [Plantactinospora sp. CA-290183]|uniref:DUF6244 family protein n=1 Tax=Plantactinospora sp. CA-290183 TaxID=3240006 RepID=UPI003D8EDF46